MTHKKINNNLIVTLPLKQRTNICGKTTDINNLIGVIEKRKSKYGQYDSFSINQLIYLDYKDEYQIGIAYLNLIDEKDFNDFCKEYKLDKYELYIND